MFILGGYVVCVRALFGVWLVVFCWCIYLAVMIGGLSLDLLGGCFKLLVGFWCLDCDLVCQCCLI